MEAPRRALTLPGATFAFLKTSLTIQGSSHSAGMFGTLQCRKRRLKWSGACASRVYHHDQIIPKSTAVPS